MLVKGATGVRMNARMDAAAAKYAYWGRPMYAEVDGHRKPYAWNRYVGLIG